MLNRARQLFKGEGLAAAMMRAFAGSAGLRIAGMALGFLVGIQLARGLGASGYGVYGLAMSTISLISIPAEFGLPQLVTREVAASHAQGRWDTIWAVLNWARWTAMKMSLALLALGLGAWILFREYIPNDFAYCLLIGAILISLVPTGKIYGATLLGLHHPIKGQLSEVVIRPLGFSCLLLFASQVSPTVLSPAMAMGMQCAAASAALLVSYLLATNSLPSNQPSAADTTQKRLWLQSAMPMALTESMRILHGNIAILVLGVFATTEIVGIFRVGSSTSLILAMPISLVHIVSAPQFAKLHATKDTKKLQRLITLTSMTMVIGVLVLTLPFAFSGEFLMSVVFGEEFEEANSILLILSSGAIIGSAFGPCATLLNMTGNERCVTRSFGLNLIILGTLIVPFIYIWGATGAAWATSIAFVGWSGLMWKNSKAKLGIDTSIVGFRAAISPNQ